MTTNTFSPVSLSDSAPCPSFDSTHEPRPVSVFQEQEGVGPRFASPTSSPPSSAGRLWLTPDRLRLDCNDLTPLCPSVTGSLRGCGHLSLPLRTPLFLSQNPPQSIYTNTLGLGEGKGVGAERGTQGINQGEKSLQSCPQLLPVCGALPRRWEWDEEGPRSARLGYQQRRCFLCPLLQTTGLSPSGNRNWETNSWPRTALGGGGALLTLFGAAQPSLQGPEGLAKALPLSRAGGRKSREGTSPGQNTVGCPEDTGSRGQPPVSPIPRTGTLAD